jgi:hypothetical protein
MNQKLTPQVNAPVKPGPGRTLAVALACLAAGAFVASELASSHGQKAASGQAPALSAPTAAVLKHLAVPLEIRFYCSLDPATLPPSMPAFAQRVEQLLSQFEREAGGKLTLVRPDFRSDSRPEKAAVADGIKPFNLDKGDACFLGITVAGKERRESLERLDPEWEQALEFDLARAIARTAQAEVHPLPVVAAPGGGPSPIEEVKRLIPKLDAVPLEEGTRLLRQAALSEFARVTQETQTRIRQAQESLLQAQTNGSDAEQQAALNQLRQLQAEQTDNLQQIAARSKAEIQALRRLKAAPR